MNNPIYYYIRDKENHPIITVCLMTDNKKTSRGIAVCSKQESPDKAYGKALAFKRAKKAMKAQDNLFIVARDEIIEILDELPVPNDFYFWKGKFNPGLSHYELELLSKNKE